MMTLTQAETEIYKKIGKFTGVAKGHVQIENQPLLNGQHFVAPTDKPWCRVAIQYADSRIASIGNAPCVRDQGIISIQCFTPKNNGTLVMTALCDQWRTLLQSFGVSHLEIYKVHAPQSMDDQDFYAKIIRAEFRVN
ncbi:phage tail terminator-like protein [Acinetobacter towneri]|uniref:phage tail terminator-like protein n=1 Tax=Acinetobacter towneri TaxID=202956 RepID=UPI0029347D72|nr:phage tail terminator-like protein [Acinetobacter towneri]WOE29735.1 phage tail terminator-like protein [Acinetobacter towneri]